MKVYSDMNGIWSGRYNYDGQDGNVSFTAWFDDKDGTLGGSTTEANTFLPDGPDELLARLDGVRDGVLVAFQKTYEQSTGISQPGLHYDGEADRYFTEVRGVWRFEGPTGWSGSFALMRISQGVERLRTMSTDVAVPPRRLVSEPVGPADLDEDDEDGAERS